MKQRAILVGLVAVAAVLAGCLDGDGAEGLDLYLFDYPGAQNWVPGTEHGWMLRISNPTSQTMAAVVAPIGVADGPFFLAADLAAGRMPDLVASVDGAVIGGLRAVLAPGESTVAVLLVRAYENAVEPVAGLRVHSMLGDQVVETADVTRPVKMVEGLDVEAGDHVRTATVGVWINGTSFYTNIAALNEDPAFPAGYDRAEFGGDALPIYVYASDRGEQPAGSKDTCHFTTITGYNELLLGQAEGGTGARFLLPEEAYTREGAEDHLLYGDALVFLNTVVGHDGPTSTADALPDASGACFNAENSLPPGLPPV